LPPLLPRIGKRRNDPSNTKPGTTTTKDERRKKFSKWINTKLLHETTGKTPVSFDSIPDRPGVVCTKCGLERFADVYDNPEPLTFTYQPTISAVDRCITNKNEVNKIKYWYQVVIKIIHHTNRFVVNIVLDQTQHTPNTQVINIIFCHIHTLIH
jgi:hypothetical protein